MDSDARLRGGSQVIANGFGEYGIFDVADDGTIYALDSGRKEVLKITIGSEPVVIADGADRFPTATSIMIGRTSGKTGTLYVSTAGFKSDEDTPGKILAIENFSAV
ncbi:hypothetical protein IMZ48_46850 [Candidatus Bathyarchaeota archaeon]|nr:hypothetical protein [Candidatus Bathyarchaeota archaeon]